MIDKVYKIVFYMLRASGHMEDIFERKIQYQGKGAESSFLYMYWKYKNDKGEEYKLLTPNTDICAPIHILYLRAKHLKDTATDPNYEKLADYYLKQIQELSKDFNTCMLYLPNDKYLNDYFKHVERIKGNMYLVSNR